jgi:hypothetical protein
MTHIQYNPGYNDHFYPKSNIVIRRISLYRLVDAIQIIRIRAAKYIAITSCIIVCMIVSSTTGVRLYYSRANEIHFTSGLDRNLGLIGYLPISFIL